MPFARRLTAISRARGSRLHGEHPPMGGLRGKTRLRVFPPRAFGISVVPERATCPPGSKKGSRPVFDAGLTTESRGFVKEFWRRRPDLNRGWRFCRFNGVVNRVVSCWSLVCPAPPFYLVLGPYWTTFGLRLPRCPRIRPLSPSPRPVRGTGVLLSFVAWIREPFGRHDTSRECPRVARARNQRSTLPTR